MILVTGATGTVGGEVLKQAVAAGVPVRALARDPARAKALKSIIEVVAGDFADPSVNSGRGSIAPAPDISSHVPSLCGHRSIPIRYPPGNTIDPNCLQRTI